MIRNDEIGKVDVRVTFYPLDPNRKKIEMTVRVSGVEILQSQRDEVKEAFNGIVKTIRDYPNGFEG